MRRTWASAVSTIGVTRFGLSANIAACLTNLGRDVARMRQREAVARSARIAVRQGVSCQKSANRQHGGRSPGLAYRTRINVRSLITIYTDRLFDFFGFYLPFGDVSVALKYQYHVDLTGCRNTVCASAAVCVGPRNIGLPLQHP